MKLSGLSMAVLLSASINVYAQNSTKIPFITQKVPNPGLQVQVPVNPHAPQPKPGVLFRLQTLPAHGTLYYEGEKVMGLDAVIADVGKVTVDPDDGNVTVRFSYVKTDAQGNEEAPRVVLLRFYDLQISGSAFHDFDGNGMVDGEKISNLDGEPLYISMVNKNNEILSSKAVSREGTFFFNNSDGVQPNSNYALIISTKKDVFKSVLPEKWTYSGENINSLAKGKDGHKDGIVIVKMAEKNIGGVAFGLDIRPTAKNIETPIMLNPGGNTQIVVPKLEGSDAENGEKVRFFIASLPQNATLYYKRKKVIKAGMLIKDTSRLTIDPDNGDQVVTFSYVSADNVAALSYPATVTMPFSGLKVSGRVFIDGDGDKEVNGTPAGNIGEKTLYATLVSERNLILSSKALDTNGSYVFTGVDGIKPESKYKVVISTKKASKRSTLPQNWMHSGEGIMSEGQHKDAKQDGLLRVVVDKKDVTQADFGLNQRPEAVDMTSTVQLNPGGEEKVAVPALQGKDLEAKDSLRYTVTALPQNAKLFYENKQIKKTPFDLDDPSKLSVDPQNGTLNVQFTYKVTDPEKVSSKNATVTLPFKELTLSGHLFNDGNNDDNVSGPLMYKADGQQIFVLLMSTEKKLLSARKISRNGSYIFKGKDGVQPVHRYFIALATEEKTEAYGLPEGWNSTGEKINSLPLQKDPKTDGIIQVNVEKNDISDIDFGINKKPKADSKETKTQLNPGRNTAVPVPTLTGTDRESGRDLVYKIASLPTLGTLYYEGKKIDNIDFIVEEPDHLMLDPDNADKIVLFSYETVDEAGVVSDPARVQMPFKGLMISGRVVNDGSGDKNVKGKPIRIPKKLKPYATLLDENDTILASNPLHRDGSFSFSGEDGVYPNADFSVLISLEANATSSVMPSGWYESSKNETVGKISIYIREDNVHSIEFGVNKAPNAETKTAKPQVNPGGRTRVTVPTLSGVDRESGTHLKYMITHVPDNATLYNKNRVVSNNDLVDPHDLTLDPKDGKQTIAFSYVTVDPDNILSSPATVTMQFTGLSISGTIFEDFVIDGNVDSANTIADDNLKLFVTLLNDKGEIITSVPVLKEGKYLFDQASGVNAHTRYRLVLSKDANTTSSTLPRGWHYADGENVNSLGRGNDGKADGMIDVEVQEIDLKEVDFGINTFLQ